MKDMDRQQHLKIYKIKKIFNEIKIKLPVSDIAETDALGGCCSRIERKNIDDMIRIKIKLTICKCWY